MIYALDTNIISYILRNDESLKQRWRLEEQNGNCCVIPLMVYYEIVRGLKANNSIAKMNAFEKICDLLTIDEITISDMKTAADIYANHKRRGTIIDDADLLIAAQCITRGYILVTHNTRHFADIESLTIVDWVM
ncbi:MAG: PIN domain-containing protein [Clostridiales bacterium]|jgi:tRNA(fMet)-specific endonuclease VapC|nr:PIN domain-containing protein [Clostridiales bacterium]